MHTAKIAAAIIILVVIITGAGIIANRAFHTTAQKLDDHIAGIENAAAGGNWVAAEKSLANMRRDWSQTEKFWSVLLDHSEIDNIESTISKLGKFIQSRNQSLALGEAALLRLYIKHIPEKESFNLKNIL